MSAISSLRHAGWMVDPFFTDDRGAPVTEQEAAALRAEAEPAIRALANGRGAHARRTIAELAASPKSDPEQVDDLLNTIYEARARGEPAPDVLDAFLDTFERWLTYEGIARVDLLFDRIDLERAPESLGILLLATTRLTRACFTRRDVFIDRLRDWLVGRSGRTAQDVDKLLGGLRE